MGPRNQLLFMHRYSQLFNDYRARWHNEYYDNSTGSYGPSQTANVLGLYLNAPPSADIQQAVVETLVEQLTNRSFAITSGALGARYLFQVRAGDRCA